MAARQACRRRKKPRKPYSFFPLTAHNNGQWCKKIRGRVHFFGVWEDPAAALANDHRIAGELHAGRQLHATNLAAAGTIVKDVCNHYLTYQLRRVKCGEITGQWCEDCHRTVTGFAKFVGPAFSVSPKTGRGAKVESSPGRIRLAGAGRRRSDGGEAKAFYSGVPGPGGLVSACGLS